MVQKRITILIVTGIIAILVNPGAYSDVVKKSSLIGPPSNGMEIPWEKCTKLAGSIILQTNPEQCVASDGRRAVKLTPATQQTIPPVYDKFSLWSKGTRLRGANVYQRMVYPNVYDDPAVWGNGPLGPVFTQEDFGALSAAGANLVVLSHPGLFDDKPPYALNESVQANLDRFIAMAGKANLFVVIAARTGPGRSEFSFFVVGNDTFELSHLNDEVWKDKAAQDAWVQMWRYTAERYRNSSVVIGYDLMVEPNSNGVWLNVYEPSEFYPAYANTTYDWNQMYPRISMAIREVDHQTPILVGGLGWSAVRWLPYLKPTGDNRTVYAIHQYEPQMQYTHQNYSIKPGLNGYPGRLNLGGNNVTFDSTWLDTLLSPVDTFKSNHGAPVAVTEYGVMRWEPGGAQYLGDEMARFEKSGMNYAVWSWQPSSKAYNAAQNEFNFRLGPVPTNLTEGGSAIYDTLKSYWARNEVRPSDFATPNAVVTTSTSQTATTTTSSTSTIASSSASTTTTTTVTTTPTTSTTSTPTVSATTTSSNTSSGGGSGIPEFPIQLGLTLLVTVVIAASYVLARRPMHPRLRP